MAKFPWTAENIAESAAICAEAKRQAEEARGEARRWVSENVKVGWIGEALSLPLAEALVPIVQRALADGAAAERERIASMLEARGQELNLQGRHAAGGIWFDFAKEFRGARS